jgi:hypothetical protein
MSYREQGMGATAVFLIPAAKLQRCYGTGPTVERRLHDYLLAQFGGYTTSAANLCGYWVSPTGESHYGEHREYRVFLNGGKRTLSLKRFLAEVAAEIDEQCICFANGHRSCFIFPGAESCRR